MVIDANLIDSLVNTYIYVFTVHLLSISPKEQQAVLALQWQQ